MNYPYDQSRILFQPFNPTLDYASMYKATSGLKPWQSGPTNPGALPFFQPTPGTPQIDFYKMLNSMYSTNPATSANTNWTGLIQNLVRRRSTETTYEPQPRY